MTRLTKTSRLYRQLTCSRRRRRKGRGRINPLLRFETLEERVVLSVATWIPQGPSPIANGQTENIPDTGAGPNTVIGAIHDIALHPSDSDIAFLGTTNGGVWQTDDLTSPNPTYTPETDHFAGLSIGAVEFDATDVTSNTVYAGTGHFSSFGRTGGPLIGLVRTTDGGDSWEQVGGSDLNGRSVSGILPQGDNILVSTNNFGSGIGGGVYLSTNGGDDFDLISGMNDLGVGAALDLVGDPTDVNRAYVSVLGVGIFYSDDQGASWENVSMGDAALDAAITGGGANNNTEMAVSPTTGRVYAGVLSSGRLIYVGFSDDQGTNWMEMDLPVTNDVEGIFSTSPREKPGAQGQIHFSIVVDPVTDTTVYIGGDRQPFNGGVANTLGALDYTGRLFRGDTTQMAQNPGGKTAGDVGSPQWEHMTHTQDAVFTGGGTANGSAPHADSRDMEFRADGILIEVDDGGIYGRTSPQDNTGDWFSLNSDGGSGLQVTEMHDIAYDNNSNVIISGHQDTGTAQQPTGGAVSWTQVPLNPAPPGDFGAPFNFSTADGGDVAVDNMIGGGQSLRYSSIQGFNVFRRTTYDATGAFVSQATPSLTGATVNGQFVTPIAVNEVAANRLVIGGDNGVFESMNRGDNVAKVNPAPTFVPALPPPAAGFTRFPDVISAVDYGAAGNAEFLYATFRVLDRPNAGGPFTTQAIGVFARSAAGMMTQVTAPAGAGTLVDIEMDSTNGNAVYTIDSNQIWQSLDGGNNWTEITGNISDSNLQSLQFVENPAGPDVILVGGEGGVFRTTTATLGTWSEFGAGLPNAIAYDMDYDATDDVLVVGLLGRGAWTVEDVSQTLFERGDPFEPNETQGTATTLGSLPEITIQDLVVEGDLDVDFFKYTAHDTGKLIVNIAFDGTENDLDLRILDVNGNELETGIQENVLPDLDVESLVIPVVSQEEYWIEITGNLPNVTLYDLEIENFPAPVPAGVHLDPDSDTGALNNDHITNDTTPTFTIIADLTDFDAMGIDILTSAEAELMEAGTGTTPGAAVEVFLHNSTTGTVESGYADAIGSSTTLFTFTPDMPIDEGVYFVTAAVRIFDGQEDAIGDPAPATGRSTMSAPLWITLDTTAPEKLVGDPNAGPLPGLSGLHADSDTGVTGQIETYNDLITADVTPTFFGRAEQGSLIRGFVVVDDSGDPMLDLIPIGISVTVNDNGNAAGNLGGWTLTSEVNMNDLEILDPLTYDGERIIRFTAEDAAGNVTEPMDLTIFIDTQGPVVTDVDINNQGNEYDLFDPKPSENGPTPPVNSLVISIGDLPMRTDSFQYDALQDEVAEQPGHYQLVGDHNGVIPIQQVLAFNGMNRVFELDQMLNFRFKSEPDFFENLYGAGEKWVFSDDDWHFILPNGELRKWDKTPDVASGPLVALLDPSFHTDPSKLFDVPAPIFSGETSMIELVLFEPLPDDRFTLTVSDDVVDPAGNALDGEDNAVEPQEEPLFPTGDLVPGGPFTGRFTIDTRAEVGVWADGSVYVDTNGNYVFDPEGKDNDDTNEDIVYVLGFNSDNIFAGNFAESSDDVADGFDKLAAYGRVAGTFRWLVDTDNNGVPNVVATDPAGINGLPVAGDFDGNAENGDEVGLKAGNIWVLDTTHNFNVNATLNGDLTGYPIVGDFDGDGVDDLGAIADDMVRLDLSSVLTGDANPDSYDNEINGFTDVEFRFGFPGVRERPVAADFDGDGIDDIGLWVPDGQAGVPDEFSEFYLLISAGQVFTDPTVTPAPGDPTSRLTPDPEGLTDFVVSFTPEPFGHDQFLQFGNTDAVPLAGNFDPPVTAADPPATEPLLFTNPANAMDVNGDGHETPLDALAVINLIGNGGGGKIQTWMTETSADAPYYDANGDLHITHMDALYVINGLNAGVGSTGEGELGIGGAPVAVAQAEQFETLQPETLQPETLPSEIASAESLEARAIPVVRPTGSSVSRRLGAHRAVDELYAGTRVERQQFAPAADAIFAVGKSATWSPAEVDALEIDDASTEELETLYGVLATGLGRVGRFGS